MKIERRARVKLDEEPIMRPAGARIENLAFRWVRPSDRLPNRLPSFVPPGQGTSRSQSPN
jgi:hypothetical protein